MASAGMTATDREARVHRFLAGMDGWTDGRIDES